MVVVIEEEEESQQQSVAFNNNNNTKTEENSAETSFLVNDDGDGFETASDGGDHDSDDDEQQHNLRSVNGGDVHPEQSVAVTKDDSYEDALNDDLNQKALTQANEAKTEGNELFKEGKYEEALFKYEYALHLAPELPKLEPTPQAAPEIPKHEPTPEAVSDLPKHEPAPQAAAAEKPKHESALPVSPEVKAATELRSICHSNRAACFMKLEKYDEAAKECSKALELNPVYVKALVRRGEAYEKLERYDEAISDMKKILESEPSNIQARRNIVRLEPLAREKMEKMKDEMIGKLKDMGNSLLGRFGMSVDNFKAVKDPNTGSYSISFQR
ncbi:uncharacterized protein LOC141607133 [Silene latifolia]|uniref:uncharacterized protein LOC141607133 n=1 Tax=Silene latifolia TaxID=37657 RepID=UPI003D78A054